MRYLLVLLGLLVTSTAEASIDCSKQPDCTSLGFVKTDDPDCASNGYMYCPFDKSYKKCVERDCAKLGFTESDKTSWCDEIVTCKDDENFTLCAKLPSCKIGDVYYADGRCGDVSKYTEDSGKIPVGVVYWVTDDGRHGKVINLHDLGREADNRPFDPANPYDTRYKYLRWGYGRYDVLMLPNYSSNDNMLRQLQSRDADLYDGQGNTDKILAADAPDCKYDLNTAGYYEYCIPQAAQAAHDFYPLGVKQDDPKVGAGQWYLPALGELMDLYGYDNSQITNYTGSTGAKKGRDTKTFVNNTLEALKSKNVVAEPLGFSGLYYWSSSEYSDVGVWGLLMNNGERSHTEKTFGDYVRVSLEF